PAAPPHGAAPAPCAPPRPGPLPAPTPPAAALAPHAAQPGGAVPPGAAPPPPAGHPPPLPPHVRKFGACTADLEALADWLGACGVTTVAMESTGIYWIALYELLESEGFEVLLIDPSYTRQLQVGR